MHFFWWWLSFGGSSGTIARLGTTTAAYASLGVATSPGPVSGGDAGESLAGLGPAIVGRP